MEENGLISDNTTEIANILRRSFAKNSDSSGYSLQFRDSIRHSANIECNLNSSESESYNDVFTLPELESALKSHKGIAQAQITSLTK